MQVNLNEQSFMEYIKEGVTLVDFWAPWSGPSLLLNPRIAELAKEEQGVKIASINLDENPSLAERFEVMSIPTILFFKNGTLNDTSLGVVQKSEIKGKLNALKKAM